MAKSKKATKPTAGRAAPPVPAAPDPGPAVGAGTADAPATVAQGTADVPPGPPTERALTDRERSALAAMGLPTSEAEAVEAVAREFGLPSRPEPPPPPPADTRLDGGPRRAAFVAALAANSMECAHLELALEALGLQHAHVLKATPRGDGWRIITHGGTALTWPDDVERVRQTPLTQAQKDGIVRSTAHVRGGLSAAHAAALAKRGT